MNQIAMDHNCTAERIRSAIANMIMNYQESGSYIDLDGNRHQDAKGILDAWEELDKMGAKLVP
jgi:hypothetical protein